MRGPAGHWGAWRSRCLPCPALIVIGIVVLVAVVLALGRRVSRQPGAFRGVIRVTGGEVPGLGMKWRRGYGRWVREIPVWTTAPLLFADELVWQMLLRALLARPIRVR